MSVGEVLPSGGKLGEFEKRIVGPGHTWPGTGHVMHGYGCEIHLPSKFVSVSN
jgi:hypothetical protein